MLLFKKRFLAAIRSGQKTQTIRLWPYRRMRAGQQSYIPGIGYIEIASVEEISLADLDEEDALRDGFSSLAELRNELSRLYVDGESGLQPFRVRFRVHSPEKQEALRAARNQSG